MLKYWLWLSERPCVTKARRLSFVRLLGSADNVYFATPEDLESLPELTQAERDSLSDKSLDRAEQLLSQCYELGIRILTYQDAQYPSRLKSIYDAPLVLYYKGRLPDFDSYPSLALIGARKASAHGLVMAKRMGYQLGKAGAIIVSGLADGIDAMGMIGALTSGTPVVGVLGCGADVIYPLKNKSLYEDIIARGCVITEYPPNTPPKGFHFPVRNRILSGLCDGVVVVEAAAKSGSLITAQLALEQGRDVFALPGSAGNEACAGSNRLLKEGALFVETGWDVMQEYLGRYSTVREIADAGNKIGLSPNDIRQNASIANEDGELKVASQIQKPKKSVDNEDNTNYIELKALLSTLPPVQSAVLEALRDGVLSVDDIIDRARRPAPDIMSALTMLEIRHYICKPFSNQYQLAENIKM